MNRLPYKKEIICKTCGLPKKNYSKGVCGSCYIKKYDKKRKRNKENPIF